MIPNAEVIIHSYDGGKTSGPICLYCFRNHGPEVKPILLTETIEDVDAGNYSIFLTGKGEGSDRLIKYLEQSTTEYIIYFQEDFGLYDKVDHKRVENLIKLMKAKKIDCLKIGDERIVNNGPVVRDTDQINDMQLHDVPTTYEYYLSHQPIAIFRREILLECLEPNETAGQNELEGSRRVCNRGYTFKKIENNFIIPYFHSIRKGNLTDAGSKFKFEQINKLQ